MNWSKNDIVNKTIEETGEVKIGTQIKIRLPDDYTSHSADALMYGLTKPSYKPCRWQRIKRNWVSYWSQYKYIWTILRGGDIHENCGDY